MRTKDVMLKAGITRKAIEYYEKQGFFTAERDENDIGTTSRKAARF